MVTKVIMVIKVTKIERLVSSPSKVFRKFSSLGDDVSSLGLLVVGPELRCCRCRC